MLNNFYEKLKKFIKEYYKNIIFFTILYILFMFPLNLYIITGGGIMEVSDRIIVEDANKSKGSLNLSYVSEIKATIATYLLSYVIKDWERVKVSDYTYSDNEDMDDVEFRGKIDLLNSNNNALKNAFDEAGKKYSVSDTSLYVYYVEKNCPNKFRVGDKVVELDGVKIKSTDEYKDIISSHNQSDVVDVVVERNNKRKKIKTTIYENDGKLITGVYISTVYKYKTYPKVQFAFKNSESGPSGGLVETLDIYNKITKKDITNGLKIVGTGEIEEDGSITEIGGVKYKLLGAEKEKAGYVPRFNNTDIQDGGKCFARD